MKTPEWKEQIICIKDGFKAVLSFEEEHIDARNHWITECGFTKEQYKEIANYYWFCAKITVYKGSVACGDNYLGGCCYKSLKEVLASGKIDFMLSGYMPQMIDEAIIEAKENLNS
tara:strand:- start:10 stop:354 length:345 start_codon:yes stop_codon:yes gene_type:complete